jgi:type III pantothenate kinase
LVVDLLSSGCFSAVLRVVADLGNSRLKWGRVDPSGRLVESIALPTEGGDAWDAAWAGWDPSGAGGSSWAIATVNPPVAERLAGFLRDRGASPPRWFRSAADVPIRHELEHPGTAGADRALAVAAAVARHGRSPGRPGLVVSCGTAITVERISGAGAWQGGAIAAGLGLSARALHLLTAQLPLVHPVEAPPAWGASTRPALEAGVFWGAVGAVRELLARQASVLSPTPWLVWTGGDAPSLAPWVPWDGASVVPDLVLEGLARVAFGSRTSPEEIGRGGLSADGVD